MCKLLFYLAVFSLLMILDILWRLELFQAFFSLLVLWIIIVFLICVFKKELLLNISLLRIFFLLYYVCGKDFDRLGTRRILKLNDFLPALDFFCWFTYSWLLGSRHSKMLLLNCVLRLIRNLNHFDRIILNDKCR